MKTLGEDDSKKVDPWRFCGIGEHGVKTHPLHIPPSKKNPSGEVTTRHFHCAHNPSRKDIFTPPEIHAVAQRHFSRLKGPPCLLALDFKNGDKFDDLIRGWTRYWNEVLNPKKPLDPNLVKALIASESGFKIKSGSTKKSRTAAWGLMQLLPDAVRILGDEQGEIKDHYVILTRQDLFDPNLAICGGVRWLFQKQFLASHRLGHEASWIEAVEEYKGILQKLIDKKAVNPDIMEKFNGYLKDYQQCLKK